METLGKLGIDLNSVLIYLVNFGILLGAIAYFITGPILRVIDERKKTIQNNLEQAEKIKNEFMEERKKAEQEKVALRGEMESQMAKLQKDLEDKRKAQDEALSLKKTKMLGEIRTMVEEEKQNLLKNAEKQALDLIAKVILHIVSKKIPDEVVKESVQEAWTLYQKK